MTVILILPTQLFWPNKLLEENSNSEIFIIEHPVYFTMYNYHKMKLVLHRSSMKYYYSLLFENNYKVTYVNYSDYENLKLNNSVKLYYPEDHDVYKELKNRFTKIKTYNSPLFLNSIEELKEFSTKYPKSKHKRFYSWQKEKYNIFTDLESQDKYNRNPFPKNIKEVQKFKSNNSIFVKKAIIYVNKNFKENPGNQDLYLPISHDKVIKMAKIFLKKYLINFGKYQDAVSSEINFGFHSILSPLMNIGLITPLKMLNMFKKELKNIDINNSKLKEGSEGYIRQLIGWREYTRMHYVLNIKKLKGNIFNNSKKLNVSEWYYDPDKSDMPKVIIDMINKTINNGYLHHIERLMYVGNYMLLSQINPKDVFLWFQSMFLDSYHVFMYPNVYGMSQYSCGPVIMNRPYFSSSNYLKKMSNYVIEKEWDDLYRKFIIKNSKILKKNYATAIQVSNILKIKNKNKK